jgi:hypothetical protein
MSTQGPTDCGGSNATALEQVTVPGGGTTTISLNWVETAGHPEQKTFNGDGQMNQVLEITNPSPHAWALVLKLTAVDAAGNARPDVTVSAVYGSDRGGLSVSALIGAIDVMRLRGEHLDRVALTSAEEAVVRKYSGFAPTSIKAYFAA